MKNHIEYFAYRLILSIANILPLKALYFISDIFAFILQYIVFYRSKVIEKNLKTAFPEITDKERKGITKKFYRNLSDVFVEALKSYSNDISKLKHRVSLESADLLNKHYDSNKSCVLMMAHYGNWEWTIFISDYFKHKKCTLYKPLRNHLVDKQIKKERENLGMYLFSPKQTGFMIRNYINAPSVFCYIIDQNPPISEVEDEYWIKFFNKETATLSGAETIAVKFDLPVYFLYFSRYKRGYYKAKFIPIELNPTKTQKGEIMTKYMSILESIIRESPESWLWSHKRWKKQKNNEMPFY